MERFIETLIRDLAVRSTGDENAVRYECFGERQCLESDSFQEIPLGQEWLFSCATDEEAYALLVPFVYGSVDVGPGLHCELARLLAEKGSVVKGQLQKVIDGTDWSCYGTPSLILAGLHYLPQWKERVERLLRLLPEDFRDGLFLSVWKVSGCDNSNSLLERFEEWIRDPEWGLSSGEGVWLGRFIAKWLSEGTFDTMRLATVFRWYFTNIVMPK